jgi:hypothetical protein
VFPCGAELAGALLVLLLVVPLELLVLPLELFVLAFELFLQLLVEQLPVLQFTPYRQLIKLTQLPVLQFDPLKQATPFT